MPKASPAVLAFNGGIFSPELEGRTDLTKYGSACRIMQNFVPRIAGAARKRSGTRFVNEVKTSANVTRLVSFEFGTTQAYVLEFGNLYMRVYRNGGIILVGAGPTVFELVTPYTTAQIDALQLAQSADVLYVAHPSHAPQKITRTAHDAWTITEIAFDWQPFSPENIDESITVYASAATGSTTLTATSGIFTSDMVGGSFKMRELIGSHHGEWEPASPNTDYNGLFATGDTRYWGGNVYEYSAGAGNTGTSPPIHKTGTETDGHLLWLYRHSGAGYVKITGYTSPTVVTGTVTKRLPASMIGSGSPTFRWSHGAWSDKNGFPRSVTFFEDRLAWAGTSGNPQTIWLSRTGQYEDHQQTDEDESALIFTLNTDQVNVIEWLSAGEVLVIGTAGAEFVLSASNRTDALTPGNVRAPRRGTSGSKSGVQPIRVGEVVLFVQRAGRKLLEFVFDFDTDSYVAPDMTILAETVTQPGIGAMAYQQEPNRLVWCVLDDGQLVSFTYEREQQVTAWHTHPIGGAGVAVESVATIPHPTGDRDQVWLIVKRTIDGATKRYVEYIEKDWEPTDIEDSFFVDSGLTYDGVAATVISGLTHLEGESVTILADGAAHALKTVSSGSITLDRSASVVQVGLNYQGTVQIMRLEAGAADGTAQGKTKRITRAVFRLYQCGGAFLYGPDDVQANMDEYSFRKPSDLMDTAVPLFSGDTKSLKFQGPYEQEGRVTFRHSLPLPCTLVAVYPQLHTQDR